MALQTTQPHPSAVNGVLMPDYYKMLGVQRSATAAEVKKAYHALALKFHPDHNVDNPRVEHQFQMIAEAYEVLQDAAERQFYDRFGLRKERLERVTRPTPGKRFEGLVGNVVDEMLGSGKRKPKSGKDHRFRLSISLEEALLGANRTIAYRHVSRCESCEGTGTSDPETGQEPCHVCDGGGEVKLAQSGLLPFKRICEFCEGRGRVILRPCSSCHGDGVTEREREYEVPIPRGVTSGKRLRIQGAGAPGVFGGRPGDMYVEVTVEEHPFFQREGQDLHIDFPLGIRSACMGAKILAPTLAGGVTVHVPPHSKNGDVLRVRGEGVPGIGEVARGDLLLHVRIELPVLEDDQLEVLTRGWEDLPLGSQPQCEAFSTLVDERIKQSQADGEKSP